MYFILCRTLSFGRYNNSLLATGGLSPNNNLVEKFENQTWHKLDNFDFVEYIWGYSTTYTQSHLYLFGIII